MKIPRLPPTLVLVAIIILAGRVAAQSDADSIRTGIVRGTIYDAGSHLTIPRVRVTIEGTKLGAISSVDGQYRIVGVPVGHYIIRASAIGYSPSSQEVVVSSAHQSVLDFELKEKAVQGDTVTIIGSNALEAVNPRAVVSTTPFSIEDVKRYAAAFQDPSRMADNFAGVFGRGTTNNYIVVRGGSPIELLWRLDGIDVPNPNHLGKNGSTGGLISAINSEMLGNSDFFTGAFPAEYGTKLSAVFDLHTRNGNSETLEGAAQLSFNGMELMGEGPVPGASG
ncbi:MAG: carboxypeptidase-like regulatory domain-containing protein, partial [Bacteroidota bacterium]|nr:carboxypeptidase-like regulatory domain-containing protein [Bacteroidota bacterium]